MGPETPPVENAWWQHCRTLFLPVGSGLLSQSTDVGLFYSGWVSGFRTWAVPKEERQRLVMWSCQERILELHPAYNPSRGSCVDHYWMSHNRLVFCCALVAGTHAEYKNTLTGHCTDCPACQVSVFIGCQWTLLAFSTNASLSINKKALKAAPEFKSRPGLFSCSGLVVIEFNSKGWAIK